MNIVKSIKFYLVVGLLALAIGGVAYAQTSITPVQFCLCSVSSPSCSASPANCTGKYKCSVCAPANGSVTCQSFQCYAYCTAFNSVGRITCSGSVACPSPCP